MASNLQTTLLRFFQYGENLARQKPPPNRIPVPPSNSNPMLFSSNDPNNNKGMIPPNATFQYNSKQQSPTPQSKMNTPNPQKNNSSRQSFQFNSDSSSSPSSNSPFDPKYLGTDIQKDEKYGARPDQDPINQNSRFQGLFYFKMQCNL